jgi:hypothetical protein
VEIEFEIEAPELEPKPETKPDIGGGGIPGYSIE